MLQRFLRPLLNAKYQLWTAGFILLFTSSRQLANDCQFCTNTSEVCRIGSKKVQEKDEGRTFKIGEDREENLMLTFLNNIIPEQCSPSVKRLGLPNWL